MTNMEKIRNRLKPLFESNRIKDVDGLIEEAYNRVCLDSRIFKRAYTTTIYKDIEQYSFCDSSAFNSYLEITSLQLTQSDILDYLSDGVNNVDVSVTNTDRYDFVIDIIDIFSEFGNRYVSIYNCFNRISQCMFEYKKCFKEDMDAVVLCSVVPDIENLNMFELEEIMRPVREYVSYILNKRNADNIQEENFEYMRYFNEIKLLKNKYPERMMIAVKGAWL